MKNTDVVDPRDSRTCAVRPRYARPSRSFALAAWVAARVPYWLLYYAARVGGGLHYCLARGKRRNYLANTSKVIKFGPGRRPWHAFQNHALNVFELLRAVSLGYPDLDDFLTVHNLAYLDRELDRGSGVIVATYHAGNWELLGLYLAMKGYRITTVAGEQLSDTWSDHIKRFKERYGIELVEPGRGMRSLYRALDDNRVVVLHIDGDAFSGGVKVPFLGHLIPAPRGAARLSRVMKAPIVFGHGRRRGRHRIEGYLEPPVPPPRTPDDEVGVTRGLMGRVEKCIVEDPGQWCIFRKL